MRFNTRASFFALGFVISSVVIASSSAHATTLTPQADPLFLWTLRGPALFTAGENKGPQKSDLLLQNLQREQITIESILTDPVQNGETDGKFDDRVENFMLTTVPSENQPLIVAGNGNYQISFKWDPVDGSKKNDKDLGSALTTLWLDGFFTAQDGHHVDVAPTPITVNFQVFDPGFKAPIPPAIWLFVTALGGLGVVGYRRAQFSKVD